MNTLPIQAAIDELDEVLRQEEPNYTEWCSDGNDPTGHLWYWAADAAHALERLL